MTPPWRVELLGSLRLRSSTQNITRFRTQQTGALVAYLAYHPGPHRREVLIEVLWPDAAIATGRNNLRLALSSLRRQLEPPGFASGAVLLAGRLQAGLKPETFTTDVMQFEAAVEAARQTSNATEKIDFLITAVELYRGPLLPGFYESWILAEEQRLEELFSAALLRLIAELEREGEPERALQFARHGARVAPHNEAARLELQRLDPASEQRARRTTRLEDTAPRHSDEPVATIVAPVHSAAPVFQPIAFASQLHLPFQFTRFFGRAGEMAHLREMLLDAQTRLVTLTGPGGSGKTRLAIETARSLASPDLAITFVPLADLSDAHLIPGALLDALQLHPAPRKLPLEQVIEALSSLPVEQSSLLVLDNFEHLAPAGAALLETLVARVPRLTLLVTSRQRLGAAGEREYLLPPLPVPPAAGLEAARLEVASGATATSPTPAQLLEYESVQLFVDRAQAVRADFQITPRNAAATAQLMQRMEGIPLAIELVAARAQVLSPAQMLSQVERGPGFEATRRQSLPQRQRTLRATMDWSYRLLPPALQSFFAQLSVFRGGFTSEAAQEVCEGPHALDVLDALAQLRGASLLLAAETAPPSGETEMRFRLLEPLREYAAQQLTALQQAALQQRHAHFYMDLAVQLELEFTGSQAGITVARMGLEADNALAALEWARRPKRAGLGLRLGAALCWFWIQAFDLQEVRRRMDELLVLYLQAENASAAPDVHLRAKAQASLGFIAHKQGDYPAARTYLEASVQTWRELGDADRLSAALNGLGSAVLALGEYSAAQAISEETLALCRRRHDAEGTAIELTKLADIARAGGDFERARALAEETLPLWEKQNSRWGRAWSRLVLGLAALGAGDIENARAALEESVALRRQTSKRALAEALGALGEAVLAGGDHEQAVALVQESLRLHLEVEQRRGHRQTIHRSFEVLAYACIAAQQMERAATLLAVAAALREAAPQPLAPADRAKHERATAAVRAALSERAFAAAGAKGRALTLEQAVNYALAE